MDSLLIEDGPRVNGRVQCISTTDSFSIIRLRMKNRLLEWCSEKENVLFAVLGSSIATIMTRNTVNSAMCGSSQSVPTLTVNSAPSVP